MTKYTAIVYCVHVTISCKFILIFQVRKLCLLIDNVYCIIMKKQAYCLFRHFEDKVCIHTCTICQQLLNTVCIISIIKYREYIEVVYVTRNIKYNLKQSFEVHPTKVAAIGHESIFHFSLYSEWVRDQQPKKPFFTFMKWKFLTKYPWYWYMTENPTVEGLGKICTM